MKNRLRNISEKYSKEIERVLINNRKYYYFAGDDSSDNFNYKILLRNKKILLFNDIVTIFQYLNGEPEIFDYHKTRQFVKLLSKDEKGKIENWLEDYSITNITLLKKVITSKKFQNINAKLHSIVFNYISMVKEYFFQIGDIKKYRLLNTKTFRSYFDSYLDKAIFSNRIDKKLDKQLAKILSLKGFLKIVNESEKYFDFELTIQLN